METINTRTQTNQSCSPGMSSGQLQLNMSDGLAKVSETEEFLSMDKAVDSKWFKEMRSTGTIVEIRIPAEKQETPQIPAVL